MRVGLLLSLLLTAAAPSVEAGVLYRFTTTSTDALQTTTSGRVWIDGDRKRVELDPDLYNPRTFDISITVSGKTTFFNLQSKTYFGELAGEGSPKSWSSSLFRLPWPNDRVKGRPKITYRNAGAGPAVGNHATDMHVIELTYRVSGELHGTPLQGQVDATVSFHTVPSLPRDSDLLIARTGFTEIDNELSTLFASAEGLVSRFEVVVARKLEGGPAITERRTMSIVELETADIDESTFAMLPGFTYQKPIFGVPGR